MRAPFQTKSSSSAPSTFTPVPRDLLQRKCACGGSPGPSGECEECRKKRESGTLQRAAYDPSFFSGHPSGVSPFSDDLLHSPEESLDAATRVLEARFGHDFSDVRVQQADTDGADAVKSDLNLGSSRVHAQCARTGEPRSDNPELTGVMPGQAAGAGPPSAELPGLPSACVVQSAVPYSRSGIIRSSLGSVTEDFEVRVEWSSAKNRGEASYCAAECGEYHQFVKGYMKASPNKDGSGLNDVSGNLFGGKPLNEKVFQEDGRDRNPKARYGHRNEKQTMNETYAPDRATGTTYVGNDSPGVHIGTFADFDLTFIGKLVDTCTGTETDSDPWRVFYRGIIRP
jgi:hypothetical protein